MEKHWYLMSGDKLRKKYYRAKSAWGIYQDSTPVQVQAPAQVLAPAPASAKKRKSYFRRFNEILRNIFS